MSKYFLQNYIQCFVKPLQIDSQICVCQSIPTHKPETRGDRSTLTSWCGSFWCKVYPSHKSIARSLGIVTLHIWLDNMARLWQAVLGICLIQVAWARIGFKKDTSIDKVEFPPRNIKTMEGVPMGHLRPIGEFRARSRNLEHWCEAWF